MSPEELAEAFNWLETDRLTSPELEALISAFSAITFWAFNVPEEEALKFAFFALPEMLISPEDAASDSKLTAQIFPVKLPELETSMDISLASKFPLTVPELETSISVFSWVKVSLKVIVAEELALTAEKSFAKILAATFRAEILEPDLKWMYNFPFMFSTKISSKISEGAVITTFSSFDFTTSAEMDCATLISSKDILNSLFLMMPFPTFGVKLKENPLSDLVLQEVKIRNKDNIEIEITFIV